MKELIELVSAEIMSAFEKAGYDSNLGKVATSKRPDLCEYQCSGAMGGARLYHKAPLVIAGDVVKELEDSSVVENVTVAAPGFINCSVKRSFLCDYVTKMAADEKFGLERPEKSKTIIVDYGGPNVAKPLHVGHLRSAVIGESIKRICRYMGHKTIGDIHLGDWGLQMGLIIYELSLRKPDLPYFDDSFTGEYPEEAPFTISELEEIYPTASKKSKETVKLENTTNCEKTVNAVKSENTSKAVNAAKGDDTTKGENAVKVEYTEAAKKYKEAAMKATYELQNGNKGYRALWKQIIKVSVTDMKRNYSNLNVNFDLWNGESTVQDRIPKMVGYLKDNGYAHISEGALVVDVSEDTDTKEIPPCMILKSDGASLYNTTDLATIQDRVENYDPDRIIYLTDKRQNLYFEQVFRCARKVGFAKPEMELDHVGFGTVNGRDGKPYKTRQGGVPRLENLISEIDEEMLRKIIENSYEKKAATAGKAGNAAECDNGKAGGSDAAECDNGKAGGSDAAECDNGKAGNAAECDNRKAGDASECDNRKSSDGNDAACLKSGKAADAKKAAETKKYTDEEIADMAASMTPAEKAEAESVSKIVGLAAIKYGDLSNQPAKDYIFDPDKFTSFEGDTGPYILYTIVRIKSIMSKYAEAGGDVKAAKIREAVNPSEKALVMELVKFGGVIEGAYNDCAPNRICAYIYGLSNACNSFYHDNRIMTESDKDVQSGWIALLDLTRKVLETCIDLLGFSAPERM